MNAELVLMGKRVAWRDGPAGACSAVLTDATCLQYEWRRRLRWTVGAPAATEGSSPQSSSTVSFSAALKHGACHSASNEAPFLFDQCDLSPFPQPH